MKYLSHSALAFALMAGITNTGAPPMPSKARNPTHGRQSPFPIHRDEAKKKSQHKPHQGARECARRRGDWELVSVIDASKRYPFGINHRLPSLLRPDRMDIEAQAPDEARIVLPSHMR